MVLEAGVGQLCSHIDSSPLQGPHRQPQRPLGRRLEKVAEAVGGGYCRLQNAIEAGTCRQGDP